MVIAQTRALEVMAQQQSLPRCPQGIPRLDTFKAAQTCSGPHPQHLVGSRGALWAGCKLRWRMVFLANVWFFEHGTTRQDLVWPHVYKAHSSSTPLKKPSRRKRQRHPTTGEVGEHAVLWYVRSTRDLLVGPYCSSYECLGHLPNSYHTR